jgi:hypothetical protein
MAAGRFAQEVEKLSDKEAVDLVVSHLKKMLPDATEPVSCRCTCRFQFLNVCSWTARIKLSLHLPVSVSKCLFMD